MIRRKTAPVAFKYDQDVATTTAIARDCNNEVYQMTIDQPDRFAGLATLPMQDLAAAIMINRGCYGGLQSRHNKEEQLAASM